MLLSDQVLITFQGVDPRPDLETSLFSETQHVTVTVTSLLLSELGPAFGVEIDVISTLSNALRSLLGVGSLLLLL